MTTFLGEFQYGTAIPFEQIVYFDDFLASPSSGRIQIQRLNDNYYWDGTAWTVSETWIGTALSSNKSSYTFTPSIEVIGRYIHIKMEINNDIQTREELLILVAGEDTRGGEVKA